MKTPEECKDGLAEYRLDVLGIKQSDVARIIRKDQPRVSYLEQGCFRGAIPPPWTRAKEIEGYRKHGVPPLTDEQFVMLIERSRIFAAAQRKLKAMKQAIQQPIASTEPLFAAGDPNTAHVINLLSETEARLPLPRPRGVSESLTAPAGQIAKAREA